MPGTEVTCPRNICPMVTRNTVTTVLEFSQGMMDTTGLVAVDKTTQSIVLSFRGSHSLRNWFTNLAVALVPADWCAGCRVHEGFLAAYNAQSANLLAALAQLRAANPGYRLVTTGHSLGGALAQIAAIDMRAHGWDVTTYTYGSPRIGNDKLSAFASTQGARKNFRVTHTDDPVPRLPLMLMGYEHVSPEYHISTNTLPVQAAVINILKGGVNWGGNTAADGVVSVNILAHLRYLLAGGNIAGCADLLFEL